LLFFTDFISTSEKFKEQLKIQFSIIPQIRRGGFLPGAAALLAHGGMGASAPIIRIGRTMTHKPINPPTSTLKNDPGEKAGRGH